MAKKKYERGTGNLKEATRLTDEQIALIDEVTNKMRNEAMSGGDNSTHEDIFLTALESMNKEESALLAFRTGVDVGFSEGFVAGQQSVISKLTSASQQNSNVIPFPKGRGN